MGQEEDFEAARQKATKLGAKKVSWLLSLNCHVNKLTSKLTKIYKHSLILKFYNLSIIEKLYRYSSLEFYRRKMT